jgi:hypothetical protein
MAGLTVSIVAGLTKDTSSVSVTGSTSHIITDNERNSFKLNDQQLKDAVGKYFGKNPNDAYLHSPTPWNDLYKTYGWPQVLTNLRPISATITGISSNPTIVATQSFKNTSKIPGTFTAEVTQQVTNTTETNWSQTNTIDVSQTIEYGISFLGSGGGGSTSFSYSYAWGQGGSKSESVLLGSSQGISVELQPGQSVKAELTASRGTMKIRIVYEASLSGATAINYNPTFKDHHFWGLDLPSIMRTANIPNSIQFTEDIEIGFYANSQVILLNSEGLQLTSIAGSPADAEKLVAA